MVNYRWSRKPSCSVSRRASLYYRRVAPSAQEIAIKHRIDELYTHHPFYGSRRLRVCLQREGVIINRKAVQCYMREMGIVAICPGPNLSKREFAHRVHPYLLRGVRAAQPDHIWGIDTVLWLTASARLLAARRRDHQSQSRAVLHA